jgi:hypothetical protein
MTQCLWCLLGLLLIVVGSRGNFMLLIFPMWIFTWLGREPLRRGVRRIPLGPCFVGLGTGFGMLTEAMAILNNRSLPPDRRVLLSPEPGLDLIYGCFYYLLLAFTWYLLIKAFTYSKAEVFVLTGIYGILTEEVGQVFMRIFTVPVTGPLYAVMVAFVYGIFPMLAYLLSEEKLGPKRSHLAVRCLVAAPVLFLEWACYGLLVLPALKKVFR